jgi:hypothetical protein
MRTLLTLLFWMAFGSVYAQVLPSDTVPAIINYTTENGVAKFSSTLRPLRQIAGAPAPFYTYFWEFGDGGFSFEKEPLHVFKLDSAKVRLFATNNYDDGKRPPTKPKPIIKPVVSKPMIASTGNDPSGLFKMGGSIELKSNCMPKPGDDMMMVFGYRNKATNGQEKLNGTIAILYNDQEFSTNNFVLAEVRTYNAEQKGNLKSMINTAYSPSKKNAPVYYASLENTVENDNYAEKIVLKDKVKDFKSEESWKFSDLKADEERFVFLHFKTTPEMIRDTNAVVRISAVFIPDNPMVETEVFNMELQIVASHDPNKMVLRKSRMNYRFTGKHRELTYKIRFQNTGKGPAKRIDVAANISEVFSQQTIRITDTKPKVVNCNVAYAGQSCIRTVYGEDSVHFVFSNIYLPGLDQKGVTDADSTMGFVEYKIMFKEKPKKLPIKTGAAIVFDKNAPIYTNRAVGRFKMGLSPALILGYGFPFETDNQNYLNNKNIVIGGSLAPYAPHRTYWQAEAYLTSFKENTFLVSTARGGLKDTVVNKIPYRVDRKDHYKTTKIITINAVPLQVRRNFNRYIGAGIGTLVSVDLSDKAVDELKYRLIEAQSGNASEFDLIANEVNHKFANIKASVFADVQLGLVRVGPAIGFRYIYDPKSSSNRMATYVTWKF